MRDALAGQEMQCHCTSAVPPKLCLVVWPGVWRCVGDLSGELVAAWMFVFLCSTINGIALQACVST